MFVVQLNKPRSPLPDEQCVSDLSHAQLLSSRVQLHDGVWLVNDNVRMHDTFLVKLAVCNINIYSETDP